MTEARMSQLDRMEAMLTEHSKRLDRIDRSQDAIVSLESNAVSLLRGINDSLLSTQNAFRESLLAVQDEIRGVNKTLVAVQNEIRGVNETLVEIRELLRDGRRPS